MNLVWSAKFTRAASRVIRRDAKLLSEIERTLARLAAGPPQFPLRTHKLKGESAGTWSCSLNFELRIPFEFVKSSETSEVEINWLTTGTHDEVD